MKDKIITILLVVLLLGGIGSLCYPLLSNILRNYRQDIILTEYNTELENMSDDTIRNARIEAMKYNEHLKGNLLVSDPFATENVKSDDEYSRILNIEKDGIIGYVEIPRIHVYEPIYHGTKDSVLSKGVGHLEHTSFPIGGIGTHAVLSGHTGLPEAEIFTNLSVLKEKDIFYIHILKETLAYQVDQIKVVEPADTSDLHIEPKQDYVTLLTCTPYGINSHRLLVRGIRVECTKELTEQAQQQRDEGGENELWKEAFGKAVIEGILIAAIILAFVLLIWKRKR